MVVYILDIGLHKTKVIDNAISAIFNKKYNDVGEFELYLPADSETVQAFFNGKYVYKENDDTVYMIESIQVETNEEDGDYITVSGKNISNMLGQRIIWEQTNFTGTVENAIRKYIDENAISCIEKRKLPFFRLGPAASLTDTITIQKTGDNLLDAITELCKSYGYGFKCTYSGVGYIYFSLYKGSAKNVIFSNEYDNLISSNYNYTKSEYRNCALVAGEGEGTSRTRNSIGDERSQENRFEIFVDARDLSTNEGEISSADYLKMLQSRGKEILSEHIIKEEFDGEISTENTFILDIDYELGDIVTIKNQYGIVATSRIIEIIECEDENGHKVIPTFDTWEVQ